MRDKCFYDDIPGFLDLPIGVREEILRMRNEIDMYAECSEIGLDELNYLQLEDDGTLKEVIEEGIKNLKNIQRKQDTLKELLIHKNIDFVLNLKNKLK